MKIGVVGAGKWGRALHFALSEKNRVNIVYTIDKGDKAKIAKIYFLGEKKN